MTVHVRENDWSIAATEDLTLSTCKYHVVTFGGTIAAAADKARWAGILKFGAQSGYNASAIYEGATKGFCGAAVSTPGWPLKVANSGWLTPCASGDQAIGRFAGTAASASGDLIPAWVDFTNLGVWGG